MLAEVIVTLLVGVAIIVIAAVVFGVWVVAVAAKGVFGGVRKLMGSGGSCKRSRMNAPAGRVCTRRGCGHVNPAEARFCTRCGMALEAARPVRMKRVAMW